jgi:hypothetical protein
VPEGRHGKGWDRFISELQIAVNFVQSCLAKNKGVKNRRSFSEVLSSTTRLIEDAFAASLEPFVRVPTWLAVNNTHAPLQVPEKMIGVSHALQYFWQSPLFFWHRHVVPYHMQRRLRRVLPFLPV